MPCSEQRSECTDEAKSVGKWASNQMIEKLAFPRLAGMLNLKGHFKGVQG